MRWLLLFCALGCNRTQADAPAAPVTDGGYLVYAVTESTPAGTISYQLKLSFREVWRGYEIRFESTDPAKQADPVKVDRALVPGENVITAFDLGRLWIPAEGRQAGKRTPCGTAGV